MNNIFSFKRFGYFFLYELNHIRSRFTHDMLVLGILPLIMATLSIAINLLQGDELSPQSFDSSRGVLVAALGLIPILFPAKMYGRVTDKRAGADWMLIPASVPEKFISTILVSTLVVPGVLALMLSGCDLLLSAVFGEIYGPSAVISALKETPAEVIMLLIFGFINTNLVFLLGAVCFRKAKAAKTFLTCFAITVLFSVIAVSFLDNGGDVYLGDFFLLEDGLQLNGERINLLLNFGIFGSMALLAGAIYYRLKTIKY